jgi:hypothetical protein
MNTRTRRTAPHHSRPVRRGARLVQLLLLEALEKWHAPNGRLKLGRLHGTNQHPVQVTNDTTVRRRGPTCSNDECATMWRKESLRTHTCPETPLCNSDYRNVQAQTCAHRTGRVPIARRTSWSGQSPRGGCTPTITHPQHQQRARACVCTRARRPHARVIQQRQLAKGHAVAERGDLPPPVSHAASQPRTATQNAAREDPHNDSCRHTHTHTPCCCSQRCQIHPAQ